MSTGDHDDALPARLSWTLCVLLPELVDRVTAASGTLNAPAVRDLADRLRDAPPDTTPGGTLDLLRDLCRLLAHPHPDDVWDHSRTRDPDPRTRLHQYTITATAALWAWYAHGAPRHPTGVDRRDTDRLLDSALAQARPLVEDPYWVLCLRIVHRGVDPGRADAAARAVLA